jgi:hypothetical protein
VRQDGVDDADAVEADHHRQAAGDGGGLEAAHVLESAHVPLDVGSYRRQRLELVVGAPGQEDPEVGLGVQPRVAAVAVEVGGHRRTQHHVIRRDDTGTGSRRASDTSRCVTSITGANALPSGRSGCHPRFLGKP